jgi:hypothetical protein
LPYAGIHPIISFLSPIRQGKGRLLSRLITNQQEKLMSGKNTCGEIGRKEEKKDEVKELALSSSESDEELSLSEETDLEEEAACYEREKYQPDKM